MPSSPPRSKVLSPTPEFPEIAEAQALLAALAESDEVKNAAASRQRRLRLQTSYGQAMMWSKGYAAPETTAAFARAQELAAGTDTTERFVSYYGEWTGMLLRADLTAARRASEKMLHEARNDPDSPEALAAHRMVALTCLFLGDFIAAKAHAEQALAIADSDWDRDTKLRFGQDSRIAAMMYLANASWHLSEFGRVRDLIEEALTRALDTAHVPTLANTYHFIAGIETFRGDAAAVRRAAETLVEHAREHSLSLYLLTGTAYRGWARARLGEHEIGVTELRKVVSEITRTGNKLYVPLFKGMLAEVEGQQQRTETALALIDEALVAVREIGTHWSAAFLHRIRGEMLLKRDPANTTPAEDAFLTAIAIAQQQKARSFELRAALALAKLYQSTGRTADAYAVLAPALEGFSPTPELSEIEEAQSLLAALAATDEVKNAAVSRQRRLQLQVSLANALLQSRGQHSPETQQAFNRARELAGGTGDPLQRFSSFYGLWVGGYTRSEKTTMTEAAEALLKEAESRAELGRGRHRPPHLRSDLLDCRR